MSLFGITPYFRVTSAIAFVESITTSNYYIGLSRIAEWDSPASDVAPPDIVLSQQYYHEIKRSCFGIKKIKTNDVCLGIKRYDWTTATVYVQYDDEDIILNTKQFYVMTSEYKVFKCLFNNNGGQSTVMPTEAVQATGDGYIWKYMFTVNASDRIKFLSNNIIPIREVVNSYVTGQIDVIQVTNGGTGYNPLSPPTVTITGDGTLATVSTITINVGTGAIEKIAIDTKGSNYSYATVNISGGGGILATAKAVIAPDNGHTSNIFYELFAYYVMIRPSIEYSENGIFTVNNNFRQAFIIKDPLDNNNVAIINDAYPLTTRLDLDTTTPLFNTEFAALVVDDIVTIGDGSNDLGTARIASKLSPSAIYLTEITSPDISVLNSVKKGSYTFEISGSGVSLPVPKIQAGNILYILNREPINRSDSQIESFYIPIIF